MKKLISLIGDFLTGSWRELKKVVWPSRQTVISHTLSVLVVLLAATVVIAVVDIAFSKLMETILFLNK
ncbi:MAG: hypothetical protein CEN88_201 [Candidatus Berkelbacteria bacterium Licking1014_2]|uniref:Protein translocase subunit SecE n=1 Tax=Candidatus Berkelbacteria bacterium Licking1014_2 TaxID=2017146 RepID=A0A554LW25_9BACT|nr:MAG: hypothetical protein CEN88_201 [Candidatus Berkelbacteria bacterium Licking1014_2]